MRLALALLLAAACSGPPEAADVATCRPPVPDASAIDAEWSPASGVLVLDYSAPMAGALADGVTARLAAVHAVSRLLLDDQRMALLTPGAVAYGSNALFTIPVAPESASTILRRLATIPAAGDSCLGCALEQVLRYLEPGSGTRAVIVVTSSLALERGTVIALAEELRAAGWSLHAVHLDQGRVEDVTIAASLATLCGPEHVCRARSEAETTDCLDTTSRHVLEGQ
jgi:hypothetical protein